MESHNSDAPIAELTTDSTEIYSQEAEVYSLAGSQAWTAPPIEPVVPGLAGVRSQVRLYRAAHLDDVIHCIE